MSCIVLNYGSAVNVPPLKAMRILGLNLQHVFPSFLTIKGLNQIGQRALGRFNQIGQRTLGSIPLTLEM